MGETMTSPIDRAAQAVREIVERIEGDVTGFYGLGWEEAAGHAECDLTIARECLAAVEAQR